MRKLFYTIGFILSLSIYGCGGSKQPSAQESKQPITTIEQKEDANEDTIADKSTKKSILIIREDLNHAEELFIEENLAVYRDTLIGRFNGKDIDTLICEPIDSLSADDDIYGGYHYKWRVYKKKGTVKDLILGYTIEIKFIKEGDLDGNGSEEWGFVTQWPTSNWMHYNIFTVRNKEWEYLIEPTPIFLGDIDVTNNGTITSDEIVRRSKKKGFVNVKFSDIRDGEFLLIDTLIQVNAWNMRKQE